MHLSGDDEGQIDLDAHDPGTIAHESSSQSSQENGDPHTPSPLYSEAIINEPDNGIRHEMQKTLNIGNVDPHFAKLLSSLSLSVFKPPVDDAAESVALPTNGAFQTLQVTPAAKMAESGMRSPSHSGTARPHRHSRTPSATPKTPPSVTSASHRAPARAGHETSPHSATPSYAEQSPLAVSTNDSTARNVSSPITRRVAAPVDVSPYLTRASTAAPPIHKQLKYISMLEHVVKESERMTPNIERQLTARGGHLSMEGPPTMLGPPLPAPRAPYGRAADPSVIYSSPQRLQPGFPHQPLPSFPAMPSMASNDAFGVRPRTSHTFHSPTTVSARPSLTEDQLYSMMSTTGPLPPPMPPATPYQVSPTRAGPPPFAPPPTMTHAHLPAGHSLPNLRLIPPHQLPSVSFTEPPLLSAPSVSPTFSPISRTNPANNAKLLSILNTPSLPRAAPNSSQSLHSNLGPS
ncbi:hypothetical protein BC835DRAFT_26566 [Cytidiella melzeri]|nr:hypothetical protein BC835DRAFT_26566 [Cytidiella melzeri]